MTSPDMSLDLCADLCAAAATTAQPSNYFGVEYGTECWCGTELHAGTIVAENEEECGFVCPGNATQKCGAGLRLNMFHAATPIVPPPPTAGGDSGTDGDETIPNGLAVRHVDGYSYKGCYTDNVGHRVLPIVHDSNDMTPQKCASLCPGAAYVGVEWSRECWCGAELGDWSKAVPGECDMACAGDGGAVCGGGQRITLYERANVEGDGGDGSDGGNGGQTTYDPGRIGDFISLGCYTDNGADGRTLPHLWADDGMTLEKCADWAAEHGYTYWGVEYARECWAGSEAELNVLARPASSGCDMKCKGDVSGTTICGGGNRISLYQYSPAPPPPLLSEDVRTIELRPENLLRTEGNIECNTDGTVTMSPGADGRALIEIGIPDGADLGLDYGEQCIVECAMKTVIAMAKKRAELTQCSLTVYLGGVPILSTMLWTTDDSYVTVRSVPAPFAVSIIIIQVCPPGAGNTIVTIGSVGFGPAPPLGASSSSSTLAPISSIPTLPPQPPPVTMTTSSDLTATSSSFLSMMATTTAVATDPSSSPAPGPSTVSSTIAVASTAAPATTSGPILLDTIPTYSAPAYTPSTCSTPNGVASCYLSGAPLPSPTANNLLAVASYLPTNNGPNAPYEACAGKQPILYSDCSFRSCNRAKRGPAVWSQTPGLRFLHWSSGVHDSE